jgi:cell division protein FtsZ
VQDKVLIGMGVTRGLGAGGDPDLGREAAEADREKIAAVVKDRPDLPRRRHGRRHRQRRVARRGGDRRGGGRPVIAFVTMPFSFEGGRRLKQAEEGLGALRRVCDAVIPLPNDMLLQEGAADDASCWIPSPAPTSGSAAA